MLPPAVALLLSCLLLPDSSALSLGRHVPTRSVALRMGLFDGLKQGAMKQAAGSYDVAKISKRLAGEIRSGVVVYTFSTCPYCIKAKQTLDGLGAKYREVQLDKDPDGPVS